MSAAAAWIDRLPKPVRQPAQQARTLWAVGALRDPLGLARQWRHRHPFARMQKALLYHRHASAVLLAHRLGLFAALADGPRPLAALAAELGVHERSLDALTRILEAVGAVRRGRRGIRLSRFGADYLPPDAPFTLAPMLELMAAQAAAFADVPAGMRDGTVPAELDIFLENSRYRAFLEAVNAYLSYAGRDVLSQIELPPIEQFIVGSMGVSFSAAVLERQPRARVTYGCLDHLVREIPRLSEQYGVPQQAIVDIHAHGGDPGADRWGNEAFDLVFLTKKMILAPEECMGEKFARKAYEVLRPGGVAIFWETLHRDRGPTPIGRAMEAVLDLGASPQGMVHSEGSLTALLQEIGYRNVRVVPALAGQTTFAVGYR